MSASPDKSKQLSPLPEQIKEKEDLGGISKLETAPSTAIYRDDFHFQSRLGKMNLSIS